MEFLQQEFIDTMGASGEVIRPELIVSLPYKDPADFRSMISTLEMISLKNTYSSKRAGSDSCCITFATTSQYLDSLDILVVRYGPFRRIAWLGTRHIVRRHA